MSERGDRAKSGKHTGMPVRAEKRKMADSRERKKERAPARKKLPIEPLRKLNRLLGGNGIHKFPTVNYVRPTLERIASAVIGTRISGNERARFNSSDSGCTRKARILRCNQP